VFFFFFFTRLRIIKCGVYILNVTDIESYMQTLDESASAD